MYRRIYLNDNLIRPNEMYTKIYGYTIHRPMCDQTIGRYYIKLKDCDEHDFNEKLRNALEYIIRIANIDPIDIDDAIDGMINYDLRIQTELMLNRH
jgi:hypothetical protein